MTQTVLSLQAEKQPVSSHNSHSDFNTKKQSKKSVEGSFASGGLPAPPLNPPVSAGTQHRTIRHRAQTVRILALDPDTPS